MNDAKKRILVAFPGEMELGGIERSLIGLLDAINYDQYYVDVFLYGHHGPLFGHINKNAHLLPESRELAYLRESLLQKILHGSFYAASQRIMAAGRGEPIEDMVRRVVLRKAPQQNKTYDLALGFFRPFDYIKEKVCARKKVGWVHTDYTSISTDYKRLAADYEGLDIIAAVSADTARGFVSLFPQYKDRTVVIENILSKQSVTDESLREIPIGMISDPSVTKLLSVGRFAPPKNFDNIPEICSLLIEKGMNIRWYIIGYGGDEPLIRRKIAEHGMEEYVIILGEKENPYPYIKACDLYVQPSRYEGKAVTVREAQMLGKPVVITDYPTAHSQLEDGVDGIIVPLDNEGCAEAISALLQEPDKMQTLAGSCIGRDYSNRGELEKIYRLADNYFTFKVR